MEDILVKTLFVLVTLYASAMGYMLKKANDKIESQGKEIEAIKLNCVSCNAKVTDEILDRLGKMLDEKLDAWWTKIENGLMNDGRLPPRKSRSNG